MPPGATPTRLPARDLTGVDVRDLRFQQALRGYKCSEVDWALERLAAEVDALRARVAVMEDAATPARAGRPHPTDPTLRESSALGGECPASTRPATEGEDATMARREITLSVDIDAPVETVWAVVTDWETQGEWMLGTDVRVTRGDGRSVGSEIAATTGVGPLGVTDTMEVVGWDPPHRATVKHTGRIVRGSGVFSVSERAGEDGRDAATFHWSELLDLPLGPLGALGWPIVRPVFALGLRHSLDALGRHCEEIAAR